MHGPVPRRATDRATQQGNIEIAVRSALQLLPAVHAAEPIGSSASGSSSTMVNCSVPKALLIRVEQVNVSVQAWRPGSGANNWLLPSQ